MDFNKLLFTTGEFANLFGIKKQTLFHYDEIGLLKPKHRTENGYRYYTIQQVEVFTIIDMLKEIGMSLTEIKNFLQSKNSQDSRELLSEKEKVVEINIKNLQRTQKLIQSKKRQIDEVMQLNFNQVTIHNMKTESYMASKDILNLPYKDSAKAVMSFLRSMKQEGLIIEDAGAFIRQEQVESGDYLNYSNLYTRTSHGNIEETLVKKAGKYAVGFHKGSYLSIHKAYEKIKEHLRKEGYQSYGDSFEEFFYLMDGIDSNSEDNYVTKIMLYIEAK